MTLKEIEAQLDQLRQDKSEREELLAAIPARLDELRTALRRAKGEINLGNEKAEARRERLDEEIAALVDEQEALTSALEILGEKIPATETKLASIRTASDRDSRVVERCVSEEADAWRRFEAALAAAAEPLQAAMAAAFIAKKHGGKAGGDRGEAARKALASVHKDGVFAEASNVPGVRERVQALLDSLAKAKIATRAIDLPELPAPPVPFVPDFRIVKLPESAAPEAQPGLVRMGRDAADEVDAVGTLVAQSARPARVVDERQIAGFASRRPARTADPETVERVSVFRR